MNAKEAREITLEALKPKNKAYILILSEIESSAKRGAFSTIVYIDLFSNKGYHTTLDEVLKARDLLLADGFVCSVKDKTNVYPYQYVVRVSWEAAESV